MRSDLRSGNPGREQDAGKAAEHDAEEKQQDGDVRRTLSLLMVSEQAEGAEKLREHARGSDHVNPFVMLEMSLAAMRGG